QMLRLPHGMLAQVYVCMLFAIVAGLSRPWIADTIGQASRRVRLLGGTCLFLLFLQLAVAVTMLHNYAGMVIPTFPFPTPDGALLSAHWDYRAALQFTHRVLAAFIGIAVAVYGHYLWREKSLHPLVRAGSVLLLALVAVPI